MPSRAAERAHLLEVVFEEQLEALRLPSFRDCQAEIRIYLEKQNLALRRFNNIHKILRDQRSGDTGSISVGPSFDKGATDSHFRFPSGARLSLFVELRESNGRSSLLAYKFDLRMAAKYYRFDLNPKRHNQPLSEPRFHLHPGADDIRLPIPPLQPLEVLDRIFLIEAKSRA